MMLTSCQSTDSGEVHSEPDCDRFRPVTRKFGQEDLISRMGGELAFYSWNVDWINLNLFALNNMYDHIKIESYNYLDSTWTNPETHIDTDDTFIHTTDPIKPFIKDDTTYITNFSGDIEKFVLDSLGRIKTAVFPTDDFIDIKNYSYFDSSFLVKRVATELQNIGPAFYFMEYQFNEKGDWVVMDIFFETTFCEKEQYAHITRTLE